jgi:hypothetical protein
MGKYILLMLFLAVTLDAFERKYEVRAQFCLCLPDVCCLAVATQV